MTVILLSFLLLFSGNWILPLMDRDEPRFAEASREMIQRHDFVVPWLNGKYRFDKPPLIYWCQAAAYRILGQNAFAARLPSVLFATATALLLLLWGKRLENSSAGLQAAVIFVTCLQLLIHGRLAVADMPMIFFFAAACWTGWEMTRPDNQVRKWWFLFYLSLGLGFLAKGPVAWLPLGGLLLGRWFRPRDFQLPLLPVAVGMLIVLFVVGLWGVPALLATQGQFFTVGIGHHVVYRSLGVMEGHGGPGWIGYLLTLPLYLLTFFLSFLPWAFGMPRALRNWWPNRFNDAFGWYLLVQAAVVFAVFSLVRTKLPHYTLPAFPVLSLWLALQLSRKGVPLEWVARLAAPMSVLALVITLGLFSAARRYFVAADLYRQARPFCTPDLELASVGFDEPSLVWEFRGISTNYVQHLTIEQARQFLGKPAPRLLILPASTYTEAFKDHTVRTMTFRSAGIDTARFRRIDLVAMLKVGEKVAAVEPSGGALHGTKFRSE